MTVLPGTYYYGLAIVLCGIAAMVLWLYLNEEDDDE